MSIIQIDDYQFSPTEENKLGQGTYAFVYKGIHKATKKPVAIKVINFDGRTPQDQHYLSQEINLMKEIDHPNVIKFYAMKKIGPCIYLVLEYCSGKDLKALLEKQPGKRLDEDTARHYMCQIASGLRYLHEKGIIHRDLKPHNLLLTECTLTADLKICDFGFARKIEPHEIESMMMNSILGSPLYMAPEILCGRSYSAKSDLWSVGCIFYEMLMGHTPLTPTSMAHLRQLAADGRPVSNFPVQISPLCKELLEGLLQKKNQQRYDWKQFLDHQYLTPENLSRSMLIKPENTQPIINDGRWLQRIYNFYPSAEHTLYVKPWNLISEVKSILAKLVGSSVNDLLLFDSTGKLLHDHLQLNYYQFQQRDQPIYVITKSFLESHQNFPPYQFKYDLPFPSLVVPANPEIPPDATLMSRLNAIHDSWLTKEEYLKSLYKNLKMLQLNLMTCKGQYENQFAIYKVLRYHVISRASELSKVLQPVEELYNKQKSLVEPLLKSSDNVLIELRNTRVHDSLQHIAKAQNLLELVDGKKFITDCSRLRDEFATLATNVTSAIDSVQKTKEEIDSLVRAKLDENQYNQITETVIEMNKTIEKARIALNNYKDRYKQTTKTVQTLRLAGSKRTDTETEQALKNGNYTELSKLFATVTSLEEESSNLASTCKQAMIKATQTMIVHLQAMGKVLFNTEHILASIQFVQTVLLQLQPTIVSCKKVSKLHSTYIESLKEIQRRREYKQKVENIYNVWNEHFYKNIYENELKKRLAFKQLYGEDLMVQLTPFFIKSEQEEKIVPSIQLILQSAENLPQISQVPVSLEDDFLVINDFSNPTEVLKTLQQENAKLLELLNNLQKQDAERKANIPLVTNEQIVELQEELAALKKDQKPIHPVPDPAFLALKEDFSSCQNQIKQMQTEIQSLQSKNQILVTKLNEKQVIPPNPNLDILNKQVVELKEKLAEAENRIVHLANPEIQRLQEMGFPLELAKEAMLSNKTVQDATNWLLEHSKIQPKV